MSTVILGMSSEGVAITADTDAPDINSAIAGKQSALVSGTNIKTINGASVLGSGNVAIAGAAAWGSVTGTLSAQTDLQSALDAKQAAGSYATAAQGAKADTAVQPAGLTKAAVGLGNADNTADTAKPVSTAQQTALDAKAALAGAVFTGAIGYATGAGGTVTQATNKATGVTLNKLTGAITMNGAALAAAAEVSFTVTNSTVAATDAVIVNHASAGTAGAYAVHAHTIGAGSFRIMVGNMSAGSLSEAIVIRFTIIKAVSA